MRWLGIQVCWQCRAMGSVWARVAASVHAATARYDAVHDGVDDEEFLRPVRFKGLLWVWGGPTVCFRSGQRHRAAERTSWARVPRMLQIRGTGKVKGKFADIGPTLEEEAEGESFAAVKEKAGQSKGKMQNRVQALVNLSGRLLDGWLNLPILVLISW